MYRLSPQLLIAAAGTMVSMGVNATDFVSAPANDGANGEDADLSWDTKFIEKCGHWSHYDYRMRASSWPFPRGLSIGEIAHYARAHHAIVETPEFGDIFLQRSPRLNAFVHAGIVLECQASGKYSRSRPYLDVYTIEGDTNADGALRGGRAMRIKRRLLPRSGDCFVRWAALPARRTALGDAYMASILGPRKSS
ncbi:MAG: hypothetical protein JWM95_696 [Gemmatimonadetes bacterium]|nr:hypothetical protein [Gemmatimonadota bacterium]